MLPILGNRPWRNITMQPKKLLVLSALTLASVKARRPSKPNPQDFLQTVAPTTEGLAGVNKGQVVGGDKITKEIGTLVDAAAVYETDSEPLPDDLTLHITKWRRNPLSLNKFINRLGYAVSKLQFRHIHVILLNMLQILDTLDGRPRVNLNLRAETVPILRAITQEAIPTSLLNVFIENSGYLDAQGKLTNPELLKQMANEVRNKDPVYQTSALLVLAKYGLNPQNIKISIPSSLEKNINEDQRMNAKFVEYVSNLIRRFTSSSGYMNAALPVMLNQNDVKTLNKYLKKVKKVFSGRSNMGMGEISSKLDYWQNRGSAEFQSDDVTELGELLDQLAAEGERLPSKASTGLKRYLKRLDGLWDKLDTESSNNKPIQKEKRNPAELNDLLEELTELTKREVTMLEKLLKNTRCLNESNQACGEIRTAIKAMSKHIAPYLTNTNAAHLAYLLKSKDERALESDLGVYMLALTNYLKNPNSESITEPARILRELSFRSFPNKKDHRACGKGHGTAITIEPEWKEAWDEMSLEERRGFIKGIILWTLGIPSYELPDAPFIRANIMDTFNNQLSVYCDKAKANQTTFLLDIVAKNQKEQKATEF